ncbi:MAG: 4-hydroxybenzoate octaprenyltransferase [Hyphomicrobiaceae bacterium]
MQNASAGDRQHIEPTVADARRGNWVDRYAPAALRPFLQLARFDRPIGGWLLMWPCWWSAALAATASGSSYPSPWHLALFLVGAHVMRGAGCVWNDLIDRKIDAEVERTRSRPLPSGRVSPAAALVFMLLLSFTGLAVLLQLNRFTIGLGIASLAIVAVYPLMKRITSWPQAVLGLAFGWGALIGWAAAAGSLALPPVVLYLGTILWVIGYDTIYAHQDKEDDALIGMKSTALRFGSRTKPWLAGLYAGAWVLVTLAGNLAGAGTVFLLLMLVAGAHLAWQITTLDIDDGANCLTRFRSNHATGLLVFLALAADLAL